MQLSNLKNIVNEMDTSSPRAATTTMSNVLTPKNKMSLFLDLPNESATTNDHASTQCNSSSAASRLSYNSAQPLTERDAKLKAFFSSTNGDAAAEEEVIDYSNNPQGRFINVKHFLRDARIENDVRVEENKEHAKNHDTSMVYDRNVDLGGRVADKKARKSMALMNESSARCQQTIDTFKKWDAKFKNICDTKRAAADADDAIRRKRPNMDSPFAITR
jgi:hypothetical protein